MSQDPHMNDIPLPEWDGMSFTILSCETKQKLRDAGDVNANSLGNSVCIAKAAARMTKERFVK